MVALPLTAYGSLPYLTFQTDTTVGRAERIVDTTLRPRGTHLGQPETTAVLTATDDDHTAVQFDARTGDVTLVGDDFLNGALAAAGEGEVAVTLGISSLVSYEQEQRQLVESSYQQRLESGVVFLDPPAVGSPEYLALPKWAQENVRMILSVRQATEKHKTREAAQNEAMANVPVTAIQPLIDEGMAHYVPYSALTFFHAGVPFTDPRRVATEDDQRFVVVTDVIGNVVKTAILERRFDKPGFYRTVWQGGGWTLGNNPTIERVAEFLAERRTQEWTQKYVEIFVNEPRKLAAFEDGLQTAEVALRGTQEFVLNLIPGYAAYHQFKNGEFFEGTLSLAGDVAMFLGGPLKALAATRGATATAKTTQIAAVVTEGVVGGVRLGQAAYEIVHADGDGIQAAGYLGEALLRLYGVKVATRKVTHLEVTDQALASAPPITTLLPGRANAGKNGIVDLAGFDTSEIGDLAEDATDYVMRQAGFEKLASKLRDGTGIDGVYVRRGGDGSINSVWIVETKFRTGDRNLLKRNFESLLSGKGERRQMSDWWIDRNIKKMLRSDDDTVANSGQLLEQLWETNRDIIEKKGALVTHEAILDFFPLP